MYGDSGKVQREQFVKIMKHFLKLKVDELNKFFYMVDSKNVGFITITDFQNATKEKDSRFDVLYKPNRNFRQKQISQ